MARTVKEWIGKTADSKIPASVKDRIREQQLNRCALSGIEFDQKNKPEFDHKTPLWLGGEHKESNLHAITKAEHAKKTSVEAKVRSKVNSVRQKHFGTKKPSSKLSGRKSPKPEMTKKLPPRTRDIFGRPIHQDNTQ